MLKGKFLVNEKCLIKKCSAKGNNMLKGKLVNHFCLIDSQVAELLQNLILLANKSW